MPINPELLAAAVAATHDRYLEELATLVNLDCGSYTPAGVNRVADHVATALTSLGVRTRPSGGTVVHLVGYGDGTADLSDGAAVTVAMDTPYLLARSRSGTLLATYSSSPASLTALARVLAGKARPTGRSPVPVPGLPRTVC